MKKSEGAPISLRCNRALFKLANSVSYKLMLLRRMLQIKIFHQEFDYRDEDVFIVTYMKSGTTLLQVLLYQILTNGDMSFNHIYDVSPWLEQSIDVGRDLSKLPSPRVLKTHSEYKYFPKKAKGKIIYCIRNGMDVAVSMFHHYRNLELSNLEWDEFLNKTFAQDSWFDHVKEWMENKDKLPIFYVRYEDLTQNMRKTAEELALFLGISLTEEVMQRALERSSFDYMKLNQEKFGARRPKDNRKFDQFIRKGESNKGQFQFNESQKDWYNNLYNKHLGKYKLGYDLPGGEIDQK